MHSSNPIIAVGVSAVIAIGSVTTAEAKPVPNFHDSSSGKIAETTQAEAAETQTEAHTPEATLPKPEAPEAIETAETAPSSSYARLLEALEESDSENTSEEENLAFDPYAKLLEVLRQNSLEETSEEAVVVETESTQAQSDPGASDPSEEPSRSGETTETVDTSETPNSAAQDAAQTSEEQVTPALENPGAEVDEQLAPAPSDLPPQDQAPSQNENPVPGEIETPAAGGDTSGAPPEYLDPNPNPLFFPTDPSEVQIVGTQPITLQQAIDLAIRNNEDIQQTRLELNRFREILRAQEAANYPQVEAGANLNASGQQVPNQIQTSPTEVEVDGSNFPNSLVLGGQLQVSYDIFTSGRRSSLIQAAANDVRSQELQIEVATEDLVQEVATRYYDLQQADEQTKISQAALDEAQRSLRDAQALERAGVGTRFDVLQAQVDVANAQQDLRNQQSQQEISRRRLAEFLNISQSLDLAAAEPVEVAGTWELSLEDSIVTAYRNRAELQQQLVQRDAADNRRRAALAQLGPQVALSGTYGLENTLTSDTGTEADDPNDDFGFRSSFQAQLGVNMLLYDGGRARAQARQEEANIAIAETNFANQRDLIRFQVEQSYSQLQANFENIQTTALAVQQAEEALRLARLRFQAGVGTQTDVLRSQTELTRSRFNNLRAILDYNRALVALQRAVSNLPEGFLNEVP